jgi:hypothetical protein
VGQDDGLLLVVVRVVSKHYESGSVRQSIPKQKAAPPSLLNAYMFQFSVTDVIYQPSYAAGFSTRLWQTALFLRKKNTQFASSSTNGRCIIKKMATIIN